MRFIHAADIHLGSKLAGKFSPEKSAIRKRELRDCFSRMVEYAKQQGINVILLAGDVFDDDTPKSKDTDYFYGVVDAHPDITFYYLRGNHDSESASANNRANLKRFLDTWTAYSLGEDTVLTGIEFTPENASSLYSTLSLDPKKKNIVTMHGQIASTLGLYNIVLTKLRDKSIDYLALGHVHERAIGKLDNRGIYAYPGCLEPRGYDELGEKGFYVVDTEDLVNPTFVPFARRTIHPLQVDISSCKDSYAVIDLIRSYSWSLDDLLRIELVGENEIQDEGLLSQIELALGERCFAVSIKDHTVPKIDISSYLEANSLRGEFVRKVMSSSRSEEEKKRIILAGLRALNGEEVR